MLRFMSMRTFALLLAALAVLAPSALQAQQPKAKKKAPAEKAPPADQAKALLEQMAVFYKGIKTLKVNAKTVMKMNMQGMNMDMNGDSTIAAERPNKFSSVSQGQGMAAMALSNTMKSDGTNMVIYMPMMKNYVEKEAPADFSGLVGIPGGGSGAESFVIGLLSSGVPGASLFDGVENAKYVGLEDLNGVKAHHLHLSSAAPGLDTMGMGNMKIDMWVEDGEKPYLRKVIPNFGELFSKLAGGGATAASPEAKQCQDNLTLLAGRKEQWSLEHNSKVGDKVSAADLEKYFTMKLPKCPSGKGYAINPIGQDPMCLSGLEGHDLASAAEAKGLEGIEGMEGLEGMGDMLKDMKMEMTFEYDGWEIDTPIAAETFTFTPPEGSTATDDLFGGFGMEGDNTLEGFGATAEDDPAKQLEGKPAPTFKLPLMGGGEFDLAAQKGKIVILDFWATWCGPCINSMPTLIKVSEEYAAKDVRLIAVNLEEPEEDVATFVKEKGWKVTVALDSKYAVGEQYMAEAIPLTVVIGKDGNVAMVHVGASKDFDGELRAKLDELLAK